MVLPKILVLTRETHWRSKPQATSYIVRSQAYDGGIGLGPGLESHGGSTYCAVAALRLLCPRAGALVGGGDEQLSPRLLEWCMARLGGWTVGGEPEGGIQGRTNKPSDSCYTFWVGAVLRMLREDAIQLAPAPAAAAAADIAAAALADALACASSFALRCARRRGGFSKFCDDPDDPPDPLHSYFALAGLAVLGHPVMAAGSYKLDAALGLPRAIVASARAKASEEV